MATIKGIGKRGVCLLLSFVLVVSLSPSYAAFAQEAEGQSAPDLSIDVFAQGTSDASEHSEFDGGIIEDPLSAADLAAAVDISKADIQLQDREYIGKYVFARGSISYKGVALEKDVDFTLSNYKNNKLPGTATVTITGIGNYTGSVEATYKVVRSEGNYLALPGKWVKTSKGYRYRYSHNGKHAANRWLQDLSDGSMHRMSKKGYALTGLQSIGGKTYLFASGKGYMKYSWRNVGGKRYYFEKSNFGAAATGWRTIKGVKYRFNSDGSMKSKVLFKISGKYYYANEDGSLREGWLTFGGNRYYFNPDTNVAVFGWQTIDGYKRYFFDDATMARNCVASIGGKTYGFDKNGHLKTGWCTLDGCTYYFTPTGSSHAAKTGLFTVDGVQYAADSTGCLLKSSMLLVASNKAGFTDENGRIVREGTVDPEDRVFLTATEDDPEVLGWKEIGGAKYFFDLEEGFMLKGWQKIDGKTYYFDANTGVMARKTSAQRPDGSWWYMGSTGLHDKNGGVAVVLNYAKAMVSKKAPYIWGGNYLTQHGTDCSGLVYYSYLKAGVKLGRTTYVQQYEGKRVGTSWSSMANAKPGDIILMYYSKPKTPEHVVMYAGKNSKGEYMIYEEPNFNMHAQCVKLSSKVGVNSQIEIRRILN